MAKRVGLWAVLSSAALLALPAAAQPPITKIQCVQASDRAQALRMQGKLVEAHAALQRCVLDACPAVVRQACGGWLGEVESSLPSIVIAAKDSDGHDVLDAKVTIDGVAVNAQAGRAEPIDPGRHRIHFERPDGTVHDEDVVMREGEKHREVTGVFPAPGKTIVGAAPEASASTPPATGRKVATPANTALGLTLAAIGAGGLVTALALDLSTTGAVDDAKTSGCGKTSTCSQNQVNGWSLDYDLAGVALGVGIVAVGVATYVLIAKPLGVREDAQKSASRFTLVPELGRGMRGGALAITF